MAGVFQWGGVTGQTRKEAATGEAEVGRGGDGERVESTSEQRLEMGAKHVGAGCSTGHPAGDGGRPWDLGT